jgi:hypothetical protein
MTSMKAASRLGTMALGVLALLLISPSQPRAAGAPLAIYGFAFNLTPGSPTDLYQFNSDGSVKQRWSATESPGASTLASVGSSLLLAERGDLAIQFGAIDRYDLNGMYREAFANVSSMAGMTPGEQQIESDSTGRLYTAFSGFDGQPRTSFRLGHDGTIEVQYTHVDLVSPTGIDATANGEVYIVNGGFPEGAIRLFKFAADGTYLDDFAIPQVVAPADLAINEATEELFIADSFGQAIVVYDLSSGSPSFIDRLPMPRLPVDVFVEPTTGRIFGADQDLPIDFMGRFITYSGFEISRGGEITTIFLEDASPREQTIRGIVAIAVPEPGSLGLWAMAAISTPIPSRGSLMLARM